MNPSSLADQVEVTNIAKEFSFKVVNALQEHKEKTVLHFRTVQTEENCFQIPKFKLQQMLTETSYVQKSQHRQPSRHWDS